MIFEEKKLLSDYTYGGYGDNALVVVYEMLVLNGHVRDNAIFTKSTFVSKLQSPGCAKKKKLTASNVEFLKSLGFAVRQ